MKVCKFPVHTMHISIRHVKIKAMKKHEIQIWQMYEYYEMSGATLLRWKSM
jgi:hypothetical protein